MALVKLDLLKALAPKDPNITVEDYDNWNENLKKTKEMEDLLKKLMKDFDILDGTKIRADILQLFKVQNNVVFKEALTPIDDKLRQLEDHIKDTQYDLTQSKEIQKTLESTMESNHSAYKQEQNSLRARADGNEAQIQALKKQIALLDEKIKQIGKAAAMGGNSAMAGDLLGDLEKSIAALRVDVDKNRDTLYREKERIDRELDTKASKEELADLENRMMQRL